MWKECVAGVWQQRGWRPASIPQTPATWLLSNTRGSAPGGLMHYSPDGYTGCWGPPGSRDPVQRVTCQD